MKKTRKKPEDKSKSDHEPHEEAQNQRAVVRQESRGLEENEIAELVNRYLAPHLTQFQNGLYTHINGSQNTFQQHIGHLYNQLNRMQEQVNYLIAQQQNQHDEPFSCVASLGGSFSPFDEETKQDNHSPQLRSNSNAEQSKPPAKSTATQFKPPAKSQSKSKISKDKKETSPNPRRSKTSDEDKIRVDYYKKFPERKRGEPAAVNIGANAGLKNSNVVCYSNAILQCLASCI